MSITTDFNRSISKVFSTSTFREVTKSGTNNYLLEKIKKYDCELALQSGTQLRDIIVNIYTHLAKNYRNEYIYKNTILNKILLGRHSLRTATYLNELKIGNSIADIVIINGTSTVYEIKTELDSADKLHKQIEDYKKVFAKIYLVTHHSLANKYRSIICDNSVGIISLSPKLSLSVIKEATDDLSNLCIHTMMKILRKGEYSSIIKKHIGHIPNISNIGFFSECRQIANKIELKEFHTMFLDELRKRSPTEIQLLSSRAIPRELKQICLSLNPSKKQYENMLLFLNQSYS